MSKGLSQGDIERRTGLLRCYTSRLENGHTIPSLETLAKLAGALDLELYQLFYTGEREPVAPQVAPEHPERLLSPEVQKLVGSFSRLKKIDQKLLLDIVN